MLSHHDELDRARTGLGIPDLIDHQFRTGVRRDEGEPFLFEQGSERVRDHPARPWPPVEGDDTTMRHPDGGLLSPLVEVLVGGGIGHLAGAAEPGRRRREEHQDRERFRVDRPEDVMQSRRPWSRRPGRTARRSDRRSDDPPGRPPRGPTHGPDRTDREPTRASDAPQPGRARRRNDTRPASRPRRFERGSGRPRAGPGSGELALRWFAVNDRGPTAPAGLASTRLRRDSRRMARRWHPARDCGRAPGSEAGRPRPGRRPPRR